MINPLKAQSIVNDIARTGYLALFTSMPTLTSTGTGSSVTWDATWAEVPFDTVPEGTPLSIGYKRINLFSHGAGDLQIMPSASTLSGGTVTEIKNQDIITFPMALDGWGTIVGYGIFTGSKNSSFSDLKYWGEFSSAQTISKSTMAVINTSDICIQLNADPSVSTPGA